MVVFTQLHRFIKMGKYSARIEDVGSDALNGLTVKEKVSFLTIGVGFNLKRNK